MSLKPGQPAPEFELYDDQKQLFRLADYHGRPVLLLFFPGAFTSVCTAELNQINNELDRYTSKDVQVVGISTDSPAVLNEFKRANHLQFPLLSDHDGEVAAAYGSKYNRDYTDMKLDRIAKRSAFLIDEGGVIRHAEVLENAGEVPDFDRVNETLASLA